jgi:hypothetical protein
VVDLTIVNDIVKRWVDIRNRREMFDRRLSYVMCGPTPTFAWEDWEIILNTSFKIIDVQV